MAATASFEPNNPAVTAHISLLQGIINRLANNSASCKTWCFTLVTGLVTLTGTAGKPGVILVVIVPLVIFSFLDARYLAQERAYRALYADIVKTLHDGKYLLPHTFNAKATVEANATLKAYFSWSVAPMYLTLIVLAVLAHVFGWLAMLVPPSPPAPC